MASETHQHHEKGRVYLVGAGPGDPGLITTRGYELLSNAQVVVYDALVNRELLRVAPKAAALIDVGKRAGKHRLNQDQINECLLEQAKTGMDVVRLKGGDPYLFGRGAEEVAYLAVHGVECEVVPGVTAGVAVPMAAGIPVTHRKLSSSVTFVTGHEDPTKAESSIDYKSLAGLIRSGGTVCFYMGVGSLPAISGQLIRDGVDGQLPVAVIQWGTTPSQRSVRSTLADAADAVKKHGLGAPSIIVVGAVAGLDEPGLLEAANRPLLGKRIVITRTRLQASSLRQKLADLGAQVIEAPTIELAAPPDWDSVDDAIRRVDGFDWVVFTSSNGVDALADRVEALGFDARHFGGVKFAVIGNATGLALRERLGIRADVLPAKYLAESLAQEMIDSHDMQGQRVLLLRADIARPVLSQMLKEAGANVAEVIAYETRQAPSLPQEALDSLHDQSVDWVTFTSSSTARNMVALLPGGAKDLSGARIASIGPITTETIKACGLEPSVEADVSNIDGVVRAILQAESTDNYQLEPD